MLSWVAILSKSLPRKKEKTTKGCNLKASFRENRIEINPIISISEVVVSVQWFVQRISFKVLFKVFWRDCMSRLNRQLRSEID